MEGTLKRSDIARRLQEELCLDPALSQNLINSILKHMIDAITNGESLKIKNFGAFHSHVQQPRMARDPQTLAPVRLPSRRIVIFRPSGAFRNAVAGAPANFTGIKLPSKRRSASEGSPPESELLTDGQWSKMKLLCPHPGAGARKGIEKNRIFLEALLWLVRTDSPWSHLPPVYGRWQTVYKRYRVWTEADIFVWLFKACADDPGMQFKLSSGHIIDLKKPKKPGLRARPNGFVN
ncbi:transposase [Sphingobium yanoikuyae]|uniref:transposase n=1 Tax=Sphingobium yanoikuyae TaxID=13690 RepID=UPI0028ACF94D|nr:transposase [Sphingobium yanoikuyae]